MKMGLAVMAVNKALVGSQNSAVIVGHQGSGTLTHSSRQDDHKMAEKKADGREMPAADRTKGTPGDPAQGGRRQAEVRRITTYSVASLGSLL